MLKQKPQQQPAESAKAKFSDSPLSQPVIYALIALVVAAGIYLGYYFGHSNADGAEQNITGSNSNTPVYPGDCLKVFPNCGKTLPSGRIVEGLTLANESCPCPANTYLSQYSQPGNKYCSCWQGG